MKKCFQKSRKAQFSQRKLSNLNKPKKVSNKNISISMLMRKKKFTQTNLKRGARPFSISPQVKRPIIVPPLNKIVKNENKSKGNF